MNSSYTGAGVLIIENYKKRIPSVILVQNKASKELMDIGGGTSMTKDMNKIINLAVSEAHEETCGLIRLNNETIRNSDFKDVNANKIGSKIYRSYVLRIDNISTKLFDHNCKLLHSTKGIPKHWKETLKLVHIPIDNIDFDTILDRGNNKLRDVNDKEYKVIKRVRNVIKSHEELLLKFRDNVDNVPYIMDRKNLVKPNTDDVNNINMSVKNSKVNDILHKFYKFVF